MVRLITQNLLSCPSRACTYPQNFPLSFQQVEKLELVEAEYNEEFLRGVLSRLEWNGLRKSAAEASFTISLSRSFQGSKMGPGQIITVNRKLVRAAQQDGGRRALPLLTRYSSIPPSARKHGPA